LIGEQSGRAFDTPIALVGFMATGKTTVGRVLADLVGAPFFDLDAVVEESAGRSVDAIFAAAGETAFRALELEALGTVLRPPAAVIATGGGTFCQPEGYRLLREGALTIWLDAPFELVLARVERSPVQRPLFRDPKQLRALYEQRRPFYQRALLRIEASAEMTPSRLAAAILANLPGKRCVT
jgi:shikimate kinase